jgi:predicted TIM-barrel fold metal-dependent hydrolase
MTIADAQLHIWQPNRPGRPWDPQQAPQLPEPFGVEDAIALMDENGVDRAVLVPPLLTGFNPDIANAYASEAAADNADRFCIVGRFDPRPADARERLADWLDQPGMKGIRLSLQPPPAPQLLEEGALDWFWPEAERLGVPIYFLRPGRTQDLAAIAERHPGLRLACIHLGLGGNRTPEALAEHVDALADLVRYPNVILTLSSLPISSRERFPFADIHDSIRRIFDLFGASRLAWAVDYTAMRGRLGDRVSYAEARDFFEAALPNLLPDEREELFNGTISRFLDWPA